MDTDGPDPDAVLKFLSDRHGASVEGLETLTGGMWSRACGYRVNGQDRVVRFGTDISWFEADRLATSFSGPDLPVPVVHEVGECEWGPFAISTRHFGQFLEDTPVDLAARLAPSLTRLLVALHGSSRREDPVLWHQVPREQLLSWRGWLVAGLIDHPDKQVHGWRSSLARDPALDRLFRAAEARIHELVTLCPERRDLVHGDLLHKNVLVNEDASLVEAVFSWKCSVRGDFLFDAAWCDFWGAWHPGVAAADPVTELLKSPSIRIDLGALEGASERLHCYELQIGATHLGWSVFVDDQKALREVAARLSEILERGPSVC